VVFNFVNAQLDDSEWTIFFENPCHPRSLRLEEFFSVTSRRDWKWGARGILGIYPEMAKILRWNTDIFHESLMSWRITNEATSFRHWAYKPQTLNLVFLQDIWWYIYIYMMIYICIYIIYIILYILYICIYI
jgi:hypothetical protein